ncbi:MAG: YraN family protein, partial [Treponema sp.]|nr:YraN family protein [Treponema sp.]
MYQNKKKLGNQGEDKACFFLKEKGFTILYRNWRTKRGEIDIIAEKNDAIVFVEVKTLPSGSLET